MEYVLNYLYKLSPILLIPYLATLFLMLAYFTYQKYLIRLRIKNVPYSTIFNIDLSKVLKNLEIQSMVHNFIIILLMLEMVSSVLWGIVQVLGFDYQFYPYTLSENSSNITGNQTTVSHKVKMNGVVMILESVKLTIASLVFPVSCLFLIVLRRIFLNLTYKHWVFRFSIYIAYKIVLMLFLSLFLETLIIDRFLHLPFSIFDLCVYISSSRSFYALLKGRRDEALIHSTRKDYLKKKKLVNRYFYAQIFSVGGIVQIFWIAFLRSFLSSLLILYKRNIFSSITFGLFPTFSLPFRR